MLSIWRFVVCVLAAGVLLLPDSGRANDGPIWHIGGSASPKSCHDSIRLDAEDVTIRLHKESYTVDAVFSFFNTGSTITEWVGFPKRAVVSDYLFSNRRDFLRFQTWVNDEEVQVSEYRDLFGYLYRFLKGGHRDDRWLVKYVTFPGQARTTTRVRYEALYDRRIDTNHAYYIYGTGSYWKDSIGKAVFIIDGSEIGGAERFKVTSCEEASARRVISENLVEYELTSFEPDPDAQLEIYFYFRK